MMSGSKMTLDEALKEIEILKLQKKKLNKRYKSLKLKLDLSKASYYEKWAEHDRIYIDYLKLQAKSKRFESNMKNVLEIEKKNAVKEFAEKLKEIISEKGTLVRDYTGDELVLCCEVDVDDVLESINELLKEVFWE